MPLVGLTMPINRIDERSLLPRRRYHINFGPLRAECTMPPPNRRLIAFAAFEGMRVLDLTGPLDAFSLANVARGPGAQASYSLRVISERGGPVGTSSGLAVSTESLSSLDDAEIDTLI